MAFHNKSIAQALTSLQTKESGLSAEEAQKRLSIDGKNILPKGTESLSRVSIFLHQWKSPLVIILLIAGVISGFLGEKLDMAIIFVTALINAAIGFIQEDKANRALDRLRGMVEYKAVVLRGGQKQTVASANLVAGDILFLEAGDTVQADGRILYESEMEINESSLTGESVPVKKEETIIDENSELGDRVNMVFRGTSVSRGRGRVVITATGKNTEIGKIALMVQNVREEETPLQEQLSRASRSIGFIVVAICVCLILGGTFASSQYSWLEVFTTAVAIAVAAIPEGLVIALTVILAIGMEQMVKRRALVRRLLAAETLGSVSVICTDKTGTITEGRMSLQEIITSRDRVVYSDFTKTLPSDWNHADALFALRGALLCNDGAVQNPDEQNDNDWKFLGDTTDIAFLRAGMMIGLKKPDLEVLQLRLADMPFSSERMYMASLHKDSHESVVFVKGAPDVLLQKSAYYEENGQKQVMTKKQLTWFLDEQDRLSGQGQRVIGVAYTRTAPDKNNLLESDIKELIFIGLCVLADPIRVDVAETITVARRAGIRVVMITGDHRRTAQYIGSVLGLPSDDGSTLDGRSVDEMSDDELKVAVQKVSLFVRVEPKHKIRIVRAFQANGKVVAMTGDGVNDAPAIKGADIGVALGSGTDVAKETSDMVLLNDSFSTIVAAVEEGRRIYQNIKKILLYLLAGSFTEVVLISWSMIAGLPLPILPAQILWMNVIIESFIAMALAFDTADLDTMNRPPRPRDESLFDGRVLTIIALITIISNIVRIAIYWYVYSTTGNLELSRTVAFVGLGIDALLFIFAVRSLRLHIWNINPLSNRPLLAAVLVGWFLLLFGVYATPAQAVLRTVPLGVFEWLLLFGLGLVSLFLIEITKSVFLRKERAKI